MDDCCINKTCAIERLRNRQTTTLRLVLLVNAAMFVVELVSGLMACLEGEGCSGKGSVDGAVRGVRVWAAGVQACVSATSRV